MQIYLPIAEVSVDALLLLAIGGMVGMFSGMFGVGGGFILTPLLFFIGIPPAVAVASAANQIAGSSFSAFLAHLQRKTVDIKMGLVLLAGGVIGSAIGVQIFTLLRRSGQFEVVVSLLYVTLLGWVGGGFIMVPAMIYLIGMPTKVVVGTSVFQFLFVTGFTTVLQAVQNGTVDVMLALILLVGGVIGAQIGVTAATRLRPEQLRILLALLVLAVGAKLFLDLVIRPAELYSLAAR
jgi:uncharacterized membrane protein YfcA